MPKDQESNRYTPRTPPPGGWPAPTYADDEYAPIPRLIRVVESHVPSTPLVPGRIKLRQVATLTPAELAGQFLHDPLSPCGLSRRPRPIEAFRVSQKPAEQAYLWNTQYAYQPVEPIKGWVSTWGRKYRVEHVQSLLKVPVAPRPRKTYSRTPSLPPTLFPLLFRWGTPADDPSSDPAFLWAYRDPSTTALLSPSLPSYRLVPDTDAFNSTKAGRRVPTTTIGQSKTRYAKCKYYGPNKAPARTLKRDHEWLGYPPLPATDTPSKAARIYEQRRIDVLRRAASIRDEWAFDQFPMERTLLIRFDDIVDWFDQNGPANWRTLAF